MVEYGGNGGDLEGVRPTGRPLPSRWLCWRAVVQQAPSPGPLRKTRFLTFSALGFQRVHEVRRGGGGYVTTPARALQVVLVRVHPRQCSGGPRHNGGDRVTASPGRIWRRRLHFFVGARGGDVHKPLAGGNHTVAGSEPPNVMNGCLRRVPNPETPPSACPRRGPYQDLAFL